MDLEVLLALEERIFEKLKVASFGIVKELYQNRNFAKVLLIPNKNGFEEIECVYGDNCNLVELDKEKKLVIRKLQVGDIVVVLFTDNYGSDQALKKSLGDFIYQKDEGRVSHYLTNGVILGVFKKYQVKEIK